MIDWRRKHLLDLAWACNICRENPALSVAQQRAFDEVYPLAQRFSTLPAGGDAKTVAMVIEAVCGACRNSSINICLGRNDWVQPCLLIQQCMRVELPDLMN
jgi:hypothetical protein